MTLVVLKIIGQSFCRMTLHLGLSGVSSRLVGGYSFLSTPQGDVMPFFRQLIIRLSYSVGCQRVNVGLTSLLWSSYYFSYLGNLACNSFICCCLPNSYFLFPLFLACLLDGYFFFLSKWAVPFCQCIQWLLISVWKLNMLKRPILYNISVNKIPAFFKVIIFKKNELIMYGKSCSLICREPEQDSPVGVCSWEQNRSRGSLQHGDS